MIQNKPPVESYGNVSIYEVGPSSYYYALSNQLLSSKRGNQIINSLLEDDELEEIMYIGNKKPLIVYHSKYNMCYTNIFISQYDAMNFISEVAAQNKRIVNEKNPLLDAALPDGSRLNATIPPASVDGPSMTIRKFKKKIINIVDLIKQDTITPEMAAFLWTCIEGLNVKPANIILAGGTGSGKTTNLNAFSSFIPYDSRIITIEDTAELQLNHQHIVRLNNVPDMNIGMKKLLINCLRMRPDRIIVGEVRGEEAKTLFTAMNTGHEGCLGTLHANTTKETLNRITNEPMSVPASMLTGLDLIVMQQRIISGKRHYRQVTEIAEISNTSIKDEIPKFNILYKLNPNKKRGMKTGVPGRIREKIAKSASITPKQFDDIVKKRENLLNIASNNNYNINQLFQLIAQNTYNP